MLWVTPQHTAQKKRKRKEYLSPRFVWELSVKKIYTQAFWGVFGESIGMGFFFGLPWFFFVAELPLFEAENGLVKINCVEAEFFYREPYENIGGNGRWGEVCYTLREKG